MDMGIEPTFWQGLEHPSLKICRPECNPGALERSSGHVGPPHKHKPPWNVVFQFLFLKIRFKLIS